MTEASDGQRRLRVIEIAVLADDSEFSGLVNRLLAGLEAGSPALGGDSLPRLVTWYDGADLPATSRSQLLGGLAAGSGATAPESATAPVRRPVGPVQPGDFW